MDTGAHHNIVSHNSILLTPVYAFLKCFVIMLFESVELTVLPLKREEYKVAADGNFSLCYVQTGSQACPASYPMGTRGSFLGIKWLGYETDHSPPSSAGVKNAWSYTSTPPYTFMAWCSVKAQGQFYLTCFSV
jgi:hypothetical protein